MVKKLSSRKIETFYLPIVLIASVVVRLVSALYLGNEVVELPGTADQISYHNLALRVLDGFGFTFGESWWPVTGAGEPTAHWSYLYTSYLIGVYSISGRNPLVARLIQVLIVGILQPYLTYQIGKKLFGDLAGLLAALWSAGYIYFIYYSAALMTEPVYITAILASIYFAMQLAEDDQKQPWKIALFLGGTLAVTILLRQLFLMFVPFMFLWIWWASGRQRILQLILVGTMIAGSILPITLYNYSRFDQFVLVNTNAGFAFYWGNHPIHGTKFISILPTEQYVELIPKELRTLSEADLEDELMDRGMQFIFDDPGRYILLSLSRIPTYFMFWPSVNSSLISNISRVLSFGVALPFIIYGLFLGLRRWQWDLKAPLTLVFLFISIYTGIHLMSWALVRYRLPIDPFFLMFAGLALAKIFELVVERTSPTGSLSFGSGD